MLNMLTTATIIIYFILGTISAYFAHKYNKNPYLWFFIGVFFGVFGLLILFFLNHQKKKQKFQKKNLQAKDKNTKVIIQNTKFWYYLTHKIKV